MYVYPGVLRERMPQCCRAPVKMGSACRTPMSVGSAVLSFLLTFRCTMPTQLSEHTCSLDPLPPTRCVDLSLKASGRNKLATNRRQEHTPRTYTHRCDYSLNTRARTCSPSYRPINALFWLGERQSFLRAHTTRVEDPLFCSPA